MVRTSCVIYGRPLLLRRRKEKRGAWAATREEMVVVGGQEDWGGRDRNDGVKASRRREQVRADHTGPPALSALMGS